MRIAIDARALLWAGIGRYTRNLLVQLAKTNHEYLVLIRSQDITALHKLYQDHDLPVPEYVTVEGTYYSWREQVLFLQQLNRIEADLFHFTNFNVPAFFRRPYVVTIHDVTRFIFPGQQRQDFLQQIAYEYIFSRAVKHAQAVIYVSKTTEAALRSLPIAIPANSTVAYEGIEEHFRSAVEATHRQKVRMLIGTSDPYLLYVGVWMSHKNLARLVQAYATIAERYPRLKLVLTGKPKPGYSNVVKMVQQLGITEQVIFAGFVPEQLLPALYAEAACFMYPSLYEGFGLPPLEAMAVGTPVVASNTSSLPEILQDAAVLVNPEYESDISQAVIRILSNDDWRHELVARGKKRANYFSWQRSAAAHVALYDSVKR